MKLCGGNRIGDSCHLGNADVTERFQFSVKSMVPGPDVRKDICLTILMVSKSELVFDGLLFGLVLCFLFSAKFIVEV